MIGFRLNKLCTIFSHPLLSLRQRHNNEHDDDSLYIVVTIPAIPSLLVVVAVVAVVNVNGTMASVTMTVRPTKGGNAVMAGIGYCQNHKTP